VKFSTSDLLKNLWMFGFNIYEIDIPKLQIIYLRLNLISLHNGSFSLLLVHEFELLY